jgi:hypothetical protein
VSSEIAPKFRGVPATDILALSEKPINLPICRCIPKNFNSPKTYVFLPHLNLLKILYIKCGSLILLDYKAFYTMQMQSGARVDL